MYNKKTQVNFIKYNCRDLGPKECSVPQKFPGNVPLFFVSSVFPYS